MEQGGAAPRPGALHLTFSYQHKGGSLGLGGDLESQQRPVKAKEALNSA